MDIRDFPYSPGQTTRSRGSSYSLSRVNPGVRHICGHDIHTAVALGIAAALSEIRDDLPGSVKLIFQPAEENVTGARKMVDAGALKNPQPEAIFAVHSAPLQVGQIGYGLGMILPGIDFVTITLTGDDPKFPTAIRTALNIDGEYPFQSLRPGPGASGLSLFIRPQGRRGTT